MSANLKDVTKGKGKGKRRGKRTVLPENQQDDNSPVIFDRVLIFDIGVKISETKDYKPIREVRL